MPIAPQVAINSLSIALIYITNITKMTYTTTVRRRRVAGLIEPSWLGCESEVLAPVSGEVRARSFSPHEKEQPVGSNHRFGRCSHRAVEGTCRYADSRHRHWHRCANRGDPAGRLIRDRETLVRLHYFRGCDELFSCLGCQPERVRRTYILKGTGA